MKAVESNPNILGGTLCFAGARVPVESLFEYFRRGYTIDYFLSQFPTVSREQIDTVLDLAKEQLPRRAAG